MRFQVRFCDQWRVYMERSGTCKSATRISLELELQNWFAGQGVSTEGATRAVQLLDPATLLAHPCPSRWNRKGTFGVQERCRYLWYRHAARILGWCERRKFPDCVTTILRGHIFPTDCGRDEETREDGQGRVLAACARAVSPTIDADQHSAGQSSFIRSVTLILSIGFEGELVALRLIQLLRNRVHLLNVV